MLSRTALVAGVALMLLACGNGVDQQANEMEPGESASADPDTTVVAMTMEDHAFEPSGITVPAGEPVTLKFENAGSVEHYFVVGDTISSDGEGFQENLLRRVDREEQAGRGP